MSSTRCLLFFPGSSPERLAKALASGADRVCLDLEDAVAPDRKAAARAFAVGVVSAADFDPGRVLVRINHPDSTDGDADLRALAPLTTHSGGASGLTVLVPKVEAPSTPAAVVERIGSESAAVRVVACIETARGLAAVEQIAEAPSLDALLFGALDMSIDLGARLDWEALLYARSRVVHAARLGRVDAIDAPFFDVSDDDGLAREASRSRALGFTAKAAIHPRQVDAIHEAFAPSADEVARARRVLETASAGEAGAFLVDGAMIDRPAIAAARRLLEEVDEAPEE